MQITLVEDNVGLAEGIAYFLRDRGHAVNTIYDGEDGLNFLLQEDTDIIILDINLPSRDGVSILKALRNAKNQTPVILLTARADLKDRLGGFDAGADDYLVKPFEPRELLLRINSILRRMPDTPAEDTVPKILHLGAIRYDIERGEMWQGDQIVRLTATESQLMKIFSARAGETLSRSQLVEDLGRDRGQAQERAVDVQITRLRRKIERDPKQPRYLQTVRGAGYTLIPD